MQFIDIQTEQTTAITDILLAIVALYVAFSIYRFGKKVDIIKTRIWAGAFGLLFLAALLGAIAHGIKMSPTTNALIWQPLNFFLGISIALFAAGVIYDLKGFSISRSLFIVIMVSGILFYSITILIPDSFVIFILYEAITMIFSLVLYIYLWTSKKLPGALLMAAGIFITMIAAVVQTINHLSITIIWEFDHNGLFHLIQIPGLLLLQKGLIIEFKTREA